VIRLMGEKDRARQEMAAAGLPIIPGSPGVVPDDDSARKAAEERIGYPLIIKASEGGGGRGMRIVRTKSELLTAFQTARSEAEQAFGSPNVYMEEIDRTSAAYRVSSAGRSARKRRSPWRAGVFDSAAASEATRGIAVAVAGCEGSKRMGDQVVEALTKIGYSSAGTVEFWREESGKLYFIEMNARIQVEHPVTEMVTGVDLVKSQIRIAAGEKLSDVVGPVEFRGHAIECRINAEDPDTFVPSPGRVTAFRVPGGPGIRVDTACYADAVIPPYYDSLIAKIIAHGRDRAEAIARMKGALGGFVVEGVKTTIPLQRRILADPDFAAGKFDTHFIERSIAVSAK